MKFTEEFGKRYVRMDLSKDESIYGTVKEKDDKRIVLKNVRIVFANGKM